MNKFIESELDLMYSTDCNVVGGVLKKWLNAKPNNTELREVVKSYMSMVFYTNKLQMERYAFNEIISNARDERNQAILRARSAEQEIKNLQEQIKLSKYEL